MVFKIVFDVNSKSFGNLEIVKNILSVNLVFLCSDNIDWDKMFAWCLLTLTAMAECCTLGYFFKKKQKIWSSLSSCHNLKIYQTISIFILFSSCLKSTVN